MPVAQYGHRPLHNFNYFRSIPLLMHIFLKSNATNNFVNLVQNTEVTRPTPSPSAVLATKKSCVPTHVAIDGLQCLIKHFCFEDKTRSHWNDVVF